MHIFVFLCIFGICVFLWILCAFCEEQSAVQGGGCCGRLTSVAAKSKTKPRVFSKLIFPKTNTSSLNQISAEGCCLSNWFEREGH